MLDCKSDRLDYGSLLAPPAGYELDRAIATTYSADLGALLSIPVALVYAHTLEGDLTGTRFQLLEAIKKFSRQVKVYHQMGQLHVPSKLNWLYAYLEDSLSPILMDDAFSAFHPKLWIIRYSPLEEGAGPKFRLIVLSRNLTFDRSWDVAACLDGTPGRQQVSENTPLLDFVRWLHERDPIDQLEPFLAELSKVKFQSPEPYHQHAFHPIGIADYREAPYLHFKARRALIMSPFLHEKALRTLRENVDNRLYLFSRRHDLEVLPPELTDQFRAYHLDDQVIEGEQQEGAEDGDTDIQKQDLHAKLFMFGNDGECTWFLGSANATKAAAERNIEFMIELRTSKSRARIQRTLKQFIGDEKHPGPFTPFVPSLTEKDTSEELLQQSNFRRFQHTLLSSEIKGAVVQSANETNFDLTLTLDLSKTASFPDLSATVLPFNTKQKFVPALIKPGISNEWTFENLSEVELSRFIHVRVEQSESDLSHDFLLRIEIDGLPHDRLENILRKIIDTPDKFFDYLRFLLADEITKEDLLTSGQLEPSDVSANEDRNWSFDLPIYEQLLVTAARQPSRLAEVDEIIQHLSSEEHPSSWIIPETFLSFWEVFRTQIPIPNSKQRP